MFEMPMLLAGLAAAAIPIIIHLLHRQRTRPINWGAMMFLQESAVLQKRRRNIEHWLLLLLRVALVALLALALARPLLGPGQLGLLPGQATSDVCVILDHSVLSGLRIGRRTVFQHGIDVVRQIARSLKPGDTLSVVLAEAHPHSLTNFPVRADNADAIRNRLLTPLSQERQGLTGASIPAAIERAHEVLGRGGNLRKTIFIVSGQEASVWRVRRTESWRQAAGNINPAMANTSIFDLPIHGTAAQSDISVGPIHVNPPLTIGVNHPVTISAGVSNSGPLPADDIKLQFTADGKPVTEKIMGHLGAGKSATISFDYRFASPGSHWVAIKADIVDALAADNQSLATVQVWHNLPVLLVDSQLTPGGLHRASRFLATALAPYSSTEAQKSLIKPTVMSVSRADAASLTNYWAVVVNDPKAMPLDFLRRLHRFVEQGHGVWFILGRNTSRNFFNQDLPAAGFDLGRLTDVVTPTHPPAIVLRDPNSPLLRPLAALGQNVISGVTLRKWWKLQTTDPREKTILVTSTGDPLAVERTFGIAGGQCVVWTTSVDGRWNDWQTRADSFVPLANQTAACLALGRRRHTQRHYLTPGSPAIWTGPTEPQINTAAITDPQGNAHKLQPQITSANRYLLVYSHTTYPGLYTLTFTPPAIPQPVYFAVGMDVRSLASQTLSKRDLAWLTQMKFIKQIIQPAQIAAALGAQNADTDLWPWMALLVLAMLVIETLLCRRMARLSGGDELLRSAMPVVHRSAVAAAAQQQPVQTGET